jgi:DNA invertase Pin-like site-specific DNA recombinase
MIKVAIYVRVSLDESKDSKQYQEPENQITPLKEFCKSFNWEIFDIYIDKMSGANPARPEFRRMMSDGMQRKFNGIVVWKLDRFSREGIMPTMSYIQQLKSRGIWLKSMTESWLDTSQEGITEIVLAIMSWASAEERKKISERTKAGIAQRKATGNWKGGRPRKTPNIDEVCLKVGNIWKCKQCGKEFPNNDNFLRKWNFHSRRHKWEGEQK